MIQKQLPVFTFLSFFILFSCSSDDDSLSSIQPSTNYIEMEAEGGDAEISFSGGEWNIAEIINIKGDAKLYGDIYKEDGSILRENTVLSLENQGKVMVNWTDRGFTITRPTPTLLKIHLNENSRPEAFNFNLVLSSEEETKEITVSQKVSQGYTFKDLEFFLKEEDGDSLFFRNGMRRKFDIPNPQSMSFSPFGGIDIQRNSQFISEENDAFIWLKNDSISVQVPTSIYEDEIYFNGKKNIYTAEVSIKPHGFDTMETLEIPAGESLFLTEIEFRKRQVSYKLYLINNRTNDEKIIEGKWIETAPTGNYSTKRLE
ncbi:hypothetical protein [Zunongwangia sp. HGR-M22]|uniref:hypothetical protein n=1 Tax=Zunongwangia sp. HGR-M22 TaxID=3015168 RepID=UPI0022DDB6AA|nr:hypothetical protein [Zunongwangia sp. HGR-M22]WBL27025.1 hypothetical protein PBT91_07075 [Zunongwangia sp. HGR-M22]